MKIIKSANGSWVKEEPEDQSNQIKSNMYRVINGKMTLNGVEVPLEVGNAEQIRCLQKADNRLNEFIEGAEVVAHTERRHFTHTIGFTCVCGRFLSVEEDSYAEYPDVLDGKKPTCHVCNASYIIEWADTDNILNDTFKVKFYNSKHS